MSNTQVCVSHDVSSVFYIGLNDLKNVIFFFVKSGCAPIRYKQLCCIFIKPTTTLNFNRFNQRIKFNVKQNFIDV